MTARVEDYHNRFPITWCPGCGNFPILDALKQALSELGYRPDQVVLVSGIGQAGKLPHYIRCNFFNGLHGRALPVAAAVSMANSDLPVIAVGGDGDMFAEGGNHFIHTLRRNPNLTVITHNNMVFGLTRGQASPTAVRGTVTKVQRQGVFLTPFNPLTVAVIFEAPFVSRGFSGQGDHLVSLIKEAVSTEGLSLVDVLQPCVSFDRIHTFKWYGERVYDLNETGHDTSDLMAAAARSGEWGHRIPIGVFYRNKDRPSFQQESTVLKQGPLIKRSHDPSKVEKLIDSFL